MAAVAAHELHLGSRQRDVEDARVGGVREVEAHDLTALRIERQIGLARDEHHVSEATHRDVRGLRFAERRDPSVLDQHVVEREQKLAIDSRPVVGLGRGHEDVPVEAELLAVVLADVGVVPVRARVGHGHLVRERLADGYRRLCLVRAVEAVLEPEAVPVHGRVDVAVVRHMDGDRRALRNLQRRAGHGAVVGEHSHGVVAHSFPYGGDLEVELVSVSELDQLGLPRFWKPFGRCRQLVDRVRVAVLHARYPLLLISVLSPGSALLSISRAPRSVPRGTARRPSQSRSEPTRVCAAT